MGRRDTHKRWGPRSLWAAANAPWEAGLRGPRGTHAGAAGSWGSRLPGTPRGHCLSVLKNAARLSFFLEASLGKFTERKQTLWEDGSVAGSLLLSKPRT